ncbi:hypothetical protein ACFLUX_01970 [Chloroflexota bacterium]
MAVFLKGWWAGIDKKREIAIYNNLTPFIPLSLQGEGEDYNGGTQSLQASLIYTSPIQKWGDI